MDETETPKPWIRQYLYTQIYYNRKNIVQLVAKKKNGKRKFSSCKFGFVHLSINCLLDSTCQIIFKNVIEF
jgi:hypothetical protein